MKQDRTRSGFTIVEVLLSLLILATLLTLLLSAFTGAGRSREALTARSAKVRQSQGVLERLAEELQGAVASRNLKTTAFACREDRFSTHTAATLIFTAFVLPPSEGGRPGTDIVKLKYFPRLSRDGQFIELFREEAALPLVENRIPTSETRMADRLKGYRFELYDGSEWVREWPSQKSGPDAILLPERVAVVLVDEEGRELRKVVPVHLKGAESSLLFSGRRNP